MFRVSIAVVACVAGFSTSGFAQNQRGAMREACKADVEKYCADVQRGGGRIGECLNKQHDQLSEAYQKAFDARTKQQHFSYLSHVDAPALSVRHGAPGTDHNEIAIVSRCNRSVDGSVTERLLDCSMFLGPRSSILSLLVVPHRARRTSTLG